MNLRRVIAVIFLPFTLHGCGSISGTPGAVSGSLCAELPAMLDSYQRGFSDVKGSRTTSSRVTVWSTKVDLVGNSCQILQWGVGRDQYVCQVKFKDEQSALTHRSMVAAHVGQCLGSGWVRQRTARGVGEGSRVIYRRKLSGKRAEQVSLIAAPRGRRVDGGWSSFLILGAPGDPATAY